ncbi:MAG TPA: histidine kinase [Kofleriaceae bacterium]|nr:histidine kinase [Kofleriaceae bacterium]
MTWLIAAVVTALWTLVGVVSGAQSSLAAALQGADPQPLVPAIVDALNQFLPWIPATLVAVALAGRFPLTRASWRRNLWVHLVAAPATAYLTNLLVVAAYWARQGMYQGIGTLAEQAAVWGLVRLHIAVLFYAAAVAVTVAIRSWRDLRRREVELARLETLLAQTRLQVLSAQIRPHFLFNTLHTIGQLWRSGRNREADEMLDHLGSLFQKVIASTSRAQIPLREELAMVRDYLAIEQARFGDRVRSQLTIEEAARSCLVPPLLLQPLVENAVKHGLSPSAAGGTVWVDARVERGRLLLCVRDDGAGPARPTGSPDTAGSGTGLSNVRERLAGLYGADQRLVTSAGDGAGTEVRLDLPATTEASSGA